MKKLKLNLADLSVTSFTASNAPTHGGTARGFTFAPTADYPCEPEPQEETDTGQGLSLDDIQCCTTPDECPQTQLQ